MRIAGACTNATFHLRVLEAKYLVPSLQVLGPQLETAYISISQLDTEIARARYLRRGARPGTCVMCGST